MTEGEIPNRLSHAVRMAVFWISLPFIFLLVGIERIFDLGGNRYQIGGCFAAAFLSIVVAVYWNRILPRRSQLVNDPPLAYLRNEDSELGSAIRDMVWCSAWGKWFAAQYLTNSHHSASEEHVMQIATHLVLNALTDGQLEVRGLRPGQLDYEPIPQTHWRSTAFNYTLDSRIYATSARGALGKES